MWKSVFYRRVVTVFLLTVMCVEGLLLFSSAVSAQTSEDVEARRERLRNELAQVEQQIQRNQSILNEKRNEAASLERDIAILDAEIQQARLEIRRMEIQIQQLGKGINQREETIGELDQKLERSKTSLARLLRETDQVDQNSLVEVMLKHETLSDFFVQLDDFTAIQSSLDASMETVREIKRMNREQKEQLSQERDGVRDAQMAIEQEKRTIEAKQGEKEHLLAVKRNEERTYESLIEERQRRAREIRTALFSLRDSAAIPFGKALTYANEAERITGVRPAFLLAILKQESELGENVGTCNRPGDTQTWRDIMPGPHDNSWRDDQTAFQQITSQLGLEPDGLPLSCPWGNGWGGAMGPSQFIPTTWLTYGKRAANTLGITMADPWIPQHAFIASALYLADLGASQGGYTAERRAALQYYAGSNWNNPQNAFYGNQVMAKAQEIQQNMIEPLQEAN